MGQLDDRKAFKEWQEYHRALKRDKAVDELSPIERKRNLEQLEKSPAKWIQFFFAEFCRYPFTPFQLKAINRICTRGEWYEVLSWSRELAKSTITYSPYWLERTYASPLPLNKDFGR